MNLRLVARLLGMIAWFIGGSMAFSLIWAFPAFGAGETEFETRASQQQLSNWNAVEFGYSAPRADQYLESERQLAALGTPRGVDAPSPVRVALNRPARESEGLFAEWIEGDADNTTPVDGRDVVTASGLAERLASPAVGMAGVAEVSQ